MNMKSPISGKEMSLLTRKETITFRKESFEVVYHYFRDQENDLEFTSTGLDEMNLNQVHNQYREKHRLPFPYEIKSIREQYELPANKMAEVLGFGVNSYRNYEMGEVPNESNARLIQLAKDPEDFRKLLEKSDAIAGKEHQKVAELVEQLITGKHRNKNPDHVRDLSLPTESNRYNGYKVFDTEKFLQMVVYFANCCHPVKTKLNKLLFYADFHHYRQTCRSISGITYIAIQHGPVPKRYETLFEMAEFNQLVTVEHIATNQGKEMNIFHPAKNVTFKKHLFSETETESLDNIANKLGGKSMTKLVELSHQEKAWLQNVDNYAAIDYTLGFDLMNI